MSLRGGVSRRSNDREMLKQKSRPNVVTFVFEERDPYTADLVRVLMHLVHNTLCTGRPFSITSVFCRFGLNLRFVARCENERLWPKDVDLPHFAPLGILALSFLAKI